ncbi:hypothetical protein C0Q70_21316 [Pomacea canaliculata]|uniref:K Homology domain-containing protein n=1 Tax=Pomacea canaliculata TaxID=400727 RepID=A0A2T7NC61_POMCA|nr:hypothetical protein C0Q70_21316 [Pomacea canaliculata]
MDILRPPLIRIGKRCYRKVLGPDKEDHNPEDEEIDLELNSIASCYGDEACDANVNIEETSNGFSLRLQYHSTYFKFIIGKKGETKKRLETETKTRITIPKMGQEGDIVIQGHEKKGVLSAKTRIEVLVDSARQRLPFTHFLSIPVQGEDVVEKFEDFKFQVIEDKRDSRIDATIFQNPQKLHLTIGTMVLLGESEIQQARNLLHDCYIHYISPILNQEPLMVDVQGLEYMNDDPGAVDVLYAKIKPGPAAAKQALADVLVDKFSEAKLMQRQREQVKLHLTVMNTLFRKDPGEGSAPLPQNTRGSVRDRESFNASLILRTLGGFDFGSFQVDRIELSQRYSTGPNGYYISSACVHLS